MEEIRRENKGTSREKKQMRKQRYMDNP